MERAYDELKRRVITLQLRPGTRIDEQTLTRELGLSRTPAREAMFQLAAEGLLEIQPKVGFVVRPIDLLDVAHLFEAQLVLMKVVARLAAHRATPQQLKALARAKQAVERAVAARDYLAMTAMNARLHRLEAEAAHSRHIQGMAESIHDQGQRLAYLCYGGGTTQAPDLDAHLASVLDDHDRMLDALVARDADAAERIAVEHVRNFRGRVELLIESDLVADLRISDDELAAVALPAPKSRR
jgi:DNA-binding GntR family transcriptional regulator